MGAKVGLVLSLALSSAAWAADSPGLGPGGFHLVELDAPPEGGARYFIRAGLPEERCAFNLAFGTRKADGGAPASPATASILRHRNSYCRAFLQKLASGLGFTGSLPAATPASQVKGSIVVLGEKQSRSSSAVFSAAPPGPWTTTRLALGDGTCDVLLNIDVHDGIGEIAPRDKRCAPRIIGELAKVLLPESGTPAPTPEKAWETLTRAEKKAVMKTRVLPHMQIVFQELDPVRYRKIDCTLCHGTRANQGQFAMPNPELPVLDFANHLRKERAENFRVTRFMFKHVAPETALALGVAPFDAATGQGFGCPSCHRVKR
jgi:hypothetical protein